MEEMNNFSENAVIKVIGVGGGGGNAVNRMIEMDIVGVQFCAINTDAQVLRLSKAEQRVQIGRNLTEGLGAGANPEKGYQAAMEDIDKIKEVVKGTHMCFVTAGMGGGTGTGAAPVVAKCAKEAGAVVVSIVTKPFTLEGKVRMQQALKGIEELRQYSDSLIVVPNDKIFDIIGNNTPFVQALVECDDVLRRAVQGISEIIYRPGLKNVDFADVKRVLENKGTALMGVGIASGPNRAIEAARMAISSPLLEIDINGATDAIVEVSSGLDFTMTEFQDILQEIRDASDQDLNINFGQSLNFNLTDEVVVTIIATGFDKKGEKKIVSEAPVVAEETKEVRQEVRTETSDARQTKVPSWLQNRK